MNRKDLFTPAKRVPDNNKITSLMTGRDKFRQAKTRRAYELAVEIRKLKAELLREDAQKETNPLKKKLLEKRAEQIELAASEYSAG